MEQDIIAVLTTQMVVMLEAVVVRVMEAIIPTHAMVMALHKLRVARQDVHPTVAWMAHLVWAVTLLHQYIVRHIRQVVLVAAAGMVAAVPETIAVVQETIFLVAVAVQATLILLPQQATIRADAY